MKNTIFGIFIGLLIALPFLVSDTKQPQKTEVLKLLPSAYPNLAKRIFFYDANDVVINFTNLRDSLKKYVSDNKKTRIGVYFEYLPTGINIGVNEKDEFYRASLIKLPVVMRIYKLMEEGKIKKNEVLRVRRDLLDETYGDLWKYGAGTDISLEEAINLTLTKSDNTAYNILLDRLNQVLKENEAGSEEGIDEIYNYFDIPKADKENNFMITPKAYSSILKSLFFASYLSFDSSSEVIEILSKSTFKDSIPKKIPDNVKIAHKNGINNMDDREKSVFSDCGIIYVPDRPYLLCVMVNSPDEAESYKIISELSEIVYNYVSKANNIRH